MSEAKHQYVVTRPNFSMRVEGERKEFKVGQVIELTETQAEKFVGKVRPVAGEAAPAMKANAELQAQLDEANAKLSAKDDSGKLLAEKDAKIAALEKELQETTDEASKLLQEKDAKIEALEKQLAEKK